MQFQEKKIPWKKYIENLQKNELWSPIKKSITPTTTLLDLFYSRKNFLLIVGLNPYPTKAGFQKSKLL